MLVKPLRFAGLPIPANSGSLPFLEAIAFFRNKINLPTRRWDDLLGAAHDRAFVVAGAMQADLLADLRAAVDKAIADGTTIETFRKEFKQIVAQRGWTGWTGQGTKAGEAWRTRVIYDTNLFTSYSAGRFQQMKEVANVRPYWRYRHSPASTDPRPEHVAWDGLILKHDDPFWAAHTPPNGFGCKCYIETLADRDMKKQGLAVTDKGKIPFPNSGVDKGWDYQPGASVAADLARLKKMKEDKLRRMSDNNNDFLEGRSRPRGELPKQAKPTEPGTISVDQLSKLEGDAKAYVVGQGKKDGKEHLYAYDLNSGKVLARATSNQREAVAVPAELTKLASDPNQQIAYHHSHPDSFSLSLRDLGLLNRRPGLGSVDVH